MEEKMRYSKEEKAKILENWRQSGKSISSYVKENDLVRWTFTKWLKAEREAETDFVEVHPPVLNTTTHVKKILIEKGNVKIHIPLCIGRVELHAILEGIGAAQ